MAYLPPAYFAKQSDPYPPQDEDNKFRKFNFDLCRAIDTQGLSITLKKMVDAGLHPQVAALYQANADSLRALLCSENNRLFGR